LAAAGDDPDVLHRAAAQHPAEVQLAGHPGWPAVGPGPGPFERPGADELSEQLKPFGLQTGRASHVQRLDQPVARLGDVGLSHHW
jgi:hypothetical protein